MSTRSTSALRAEGWRRGHRADSMVHKAMSSYTLQTLLTPLLQHAPPEGAASTCLMEGLAPLHVMTWQQSGFPCSPLLTADAEVAEMENAEFGPQLWRITQWINPHNRLSKVYHWSKVPSVKSNHACSTVAKGLFILSITCNSNTANHSVL